MYNINLILLPIFFFFILGCGDNHYRNQIPKEVDFEDAGTGELLFGQNNLDEIPIHVAISAMISPKETFKKYEELILYLSDKLERQIVLKQRKTYGEVNNLLMKGKLDFALVCSGALVEAERKFPIKILAVPVINGEPLYYAYVIVNNTSNIKNFLDLKNKSFAYTDPLSNTGHKYGKKLITDFGYDPETYFSQTIFTYAHDYSIQAVARKIVDGATIDGLIFDYLENYDSSKVANIRIIKKSKPFGMPPLVYTDKSDIAIIQKIRTILFNMHNDRKGGKILKSLRIDKFIEGSTDLYDSIREFY